MLGSTQPRSRGTEVPYTTVQRMAAAGNVRLARQLDYDHRILVSDRAGEDVWASYPANGALEDQLLTTLSRKGASVVIDAQSGKQAKRLIVQVLLPILILASLFALFMRISQQSDASGMGGVQPLGRPALQARPRPPGRPVVRRRRGRARRRRRAARSSAICCATPTATARSAPARRRARCSSARPARARRCSRARPPARRTPRSSRSPARSSSSRSSASARPASATCSPRRAARRPRSSSSTSSTPSAASAARASGRATTSASRRSTSCWWRWTASTPAAA